MSNSSKKRRNRLGVFLAALSLATTAKSNFASAATSYSNKYSDNQSLGAGKQVISDIEWESILDSYVDVAKCKSVVGELSNDLSALRRYVAMLKNYAKSFEDKLSEQHAERPGMIARFFGGDINSAADSIEQKTNAAYMSFKGFCDNIGLGQNQKTGLEPSLNAFLDDISKKFPNIYAIEQIKAEYDNLHLNFVDMVSAFELLPGEVAKAKDSNGMERYDGYADVLKKLEAVRRLVQEASNKLDKIENIAMQFVNEASSVVNRVEARNLEKEKKQKEEQERIEREAQEKLEREKKAAKEQKQKEMEEARRNKEEAERKFFAEKSKWQKEFAEILERTDNEFEAICKNSDSDVGELIRKNQGNSVAEFRSSVEAEIEILNDLKEYDEINLQKVIDMRTKSLDIKE